MGNLLRGSKIMDDVLILFIEKNSRHPSCLLQSICFPEIDRFFAFETQKNQPGRTERTSRSLVEKI